MGKKPKWKDEFVDIDVKYVGDDLLLQMFDEDVCGSDFIGETSIKLSAFCVGSGLDEWYQINHKGKKAGKINIKSEWTPSGMQLMQRDPNQRDPPPIVVFTNG